MSKAEKWHMILSDQDWKTLNTEISAVLAVKTMIQMNHGIMKQGARFSQKYILQRGIKEFSDQGVKSATKEILQLHRLCCFQPTEISK